MKRKANKKHTSSFAGRASKQHTVFAAIVIQLLYWQNYVHLYSFASILKMIWHIAQLTKINSLESKKMQNVKIFAYEHA